MTPNPPMPANPHAAAPLRTDGAPLGAARVAVIMIHGRGGSAADFLALHRRLPAEVGGGEGGDGGGVAYLAPQASEATAHPRQWYPFSFLRPVEENEPALSWSLERIAGVLAGVEAAGVPAERTVLLGFSQGACLASEFVARNPRRYGGLVALAGGLIGAPGALRAYAGDLAGTPVFLGASVPDPHIPIERVEETRDALARLGAAVELRPYPGFPHAVIPEHLEAAAGIIVGAGGSRKEDAS